MSRKQPQPVDPNLVKPEPPPAPPEARFTIDTVFKAMDQMSGEMRKRQAKFGKVKRGIAK